ERGGRILYSRYSHHRHVRLGVLGGLERLHQHAALLLGGAAQAPAQIGDAPQHGVGAFGGFHGQRQAFADDRALAHIQRAQRMHDPHGPFDIGLVLRVGCQAPQRSFRRHQGGRGLRHADRLQACVLADADNEAQQRIVAFFGRGDSLGQQQNALGIQLHLVELGPVDAPAEQHLAGARAIQRLDDAARLARRQELVREILDPILGHAAHQRHDKDVPARLAHGMRHRAGQFAATRDKSEGCHSDAPRRRARQSSCLASARMKSTISLTSVTPAKRARAARARDAMEPSEPWNTSRKVARMALMVWRDRPRRFSPIRFRPASSTWSPNAMAYGITSRLTPVRPPIIAPLPTRQNCCTAARPPKITPSPISTWPPSATELAKVTLSPTWQSWPTWELAMK